VDLNRRCCSIGERTLQEGEVISLDGDSGRIYAGSIAVIEERPEAALRQVAGWRAAKNLTAKDPESNESAIG
jgi:pyruvate,orthophosphate dikinase